MVSYRYVKVEVDPPIGWMIFNRPEKLNAMNKDMLDEATKAVEDLEGEGGVHFYNIHGGWKGVQCWHRLV